MIEIRQLEVGYGNKPPVLQIEQLSIAEGERVVVIGASGTFRPRRSPPNRPASSSRVVVPLSRIGREPPFGEHVVWRAQTYALC